MPDGPMEKGVGAGVAGIPVLPPELMPSSTLTVLVSKKVFVYSLTNFAPKKHAGYLHGKLFVKTRNVNAFNCCSKFYLTSVGFALAMMIS